jgi:F0F1-type ATP synthase epsilon subunit
VFSPFRLIVSLPGDNLLDQAGVTEVYAQLADGGGIGILPGHGPLLAETVVGTLRYVNGDGEHTLQLQAGVLRVDSGRVTLYTTGRSEFGTEPERHEQTAEEGRLVRLARTLLRR